MVSGGVADYVYNDFNPISMSQVSEWGDIGPLLGWAMREELTAAGIVPVKPTETIRATVIGAGTHSMNLSGSTITVWEEALPLRNVTVVSPFPQGIPATVAEIAAAVAQVVDRIVSDGSAQIIALAMEGPKEASFLAIQELAAGLVQGTAEYLKAQKPLVVVLQKDCAKVLGQCLQILIGARRRSSASIRSGWTKGIISISANP